MRGVVDYLQIKTARGRCKYGFIIGEDGKKYWFSVSGLRTLSLGDRVSFNGGRDEKGYIASQVSIIA